MMNGYNRAGCKYFLFIRNEFGEFMRKLIKE